MKKLRPALIALTATLALAVTACGSDSAPDNTAASASTSASTSSTSASTSSTSATGTSSVATSGTDLDAIRAAIAAAEKKAGGTAYEIDDQDDDGSWEVDVAKGAKSIEVDVAADATATIDDDQDDVDEEDRAGLKAATIDLADAIDAALQEVDGTFDDAELEEEDGKHHWEVTIDTASDDDVEVHVDVRTGKATPEQDG